MPGAYANVHADLAGDAGTFRIPASALIFDTSGLRIATVGADDRVHFKKVTIARDLGSEIEIGSGLSAEDRVIAAPPDGIADGDPVRIVGGPESAPRTASAKPEFRRLIAQVRRSGAAHRRGTSPRFRSRAPPG